MMSCLTPIDPSCLRLQSHEQPDSPIGGSNSGGEKARFRNAVLMTSIYVGAAVLFGCGVWYVRGKESALQFYAGYLVEQSLSVDNLFVFLMLFNYFQVSEPRAPGAFFAGVGDLGNVTYIAARLNLTVRFRSRTKGVC